MVGVLPSSMETIIRDMTKQFAAKDEEMIRTMGVPLYIQTIQQPNAYGGWVVKRVYSRVQPPGECVKIG